MDISDKDRRAGRRLKDQLRLHKDRAVRSASSRRLSVITHSTASLFLVSLPVSPLPCILNSDEARSGYSAGEALRRCVNGSPGLSPTLPWGARSAGAPFPPQEDGHAGHRSWREEPELGLEVGAR